MRNKKIEFYKHNISSIDIKECVEVLKSLFLTTGSIVKEFEEKLAAYLDVRYAVGVTSCTDALFLALKGLGIKEGDEVITTPLSFIATANVIEYCGAKPVFVDVESTTGNINVENIERAITSKTKALLVVHLYGQMCDMQKIAAIAKKHSLKVIEDSAHCIEGVRDGIRPGQLSDAACFSFYATKNITSGEGGAVVTNNKDFYNWLLRARQHGMSKSASERYTKKYEHYDMEFLGFKANMNNIQAALLLHQLDRIEELLKKKEKIAQRYDSAFKKNPFISIPAILPSTKHARHIYTIWVDPNKRDNILRLLQDKMIGVAVNFRPIHLMSYYKKRYGYKQGDFPIAEKIGASTITIPLYPKLTSEEVDYIINTINKITQK
jgi:dTDP-4-amino-4,6-dideoxygalactose transaminase